VDGAVVHGCRSCNGLWIPKETLEPLVERGAALTPAAAGGDRPQRLSGDVRYLKCPECDGLMARRNYGRVSGVIIDSCPSHGIWLDGGELAALRRFVASGGRKRQERADREKERVEEELRAIRRRPLGGSVLRDVGGWGTGGFGLD
jgi:Zn-finger nucleic acid-binding protein